MMITQAKLKLEKTSKTELGSALGAKIHGYLLNKMPEKTAEKLHSFGEIRPFSLAVNTKMKDYDVLIVNALNSEACCLIDWILEIGQIELTGLPEAIQVLEKKEKKIKKLSELSEVVETEKIRLSFFSPTTYKVDNRYSDQFNLSRILMNPIKKVNAFEGGDIEAKDFYAINENFKIIAYHLRSRKYSIKKNRISGFIGEVEGTLEGSLELIKKINLILNYSQYTGIGAKTSMGMGGFSYRNVF
ncbi:MAG: CRISPR system precrRNA processing endoribonuclease RAMP protein Cas6 [Eubacteriaceae bacterium]